ncbi:LLM class flavin-dependent oxidoreductase, partial [Bradyrhizobium sp.]|uniref:LLM class flavin-dependent oxidoreductase n=1 Tax=Bradyrhizobium sp. TaxID=376 RepID=UPI003C41E013
PLLFAGNDTPVEPWSMAQHLLAHTTRISPLIAVNPGYMHPFTVAKFVSSFVLLHGRKVYLNMITGTATSDRLGLGEQHSHQERYSRLREFIFIVRQLLTSTRPVTFHGEFYTTNNLQLRPGLPPTLMPEFLIAGQSDDARQTAAEMGCLAMQMLPPDLERGIDASGLNFGIFARAERDQARHAAEMRFQDCAEKRELLQYSMENTDSVWKRQLNEAGHDGKLCKSGYWLLPFSTFEADCPYLVGSYAEIGAKLRQFTELGVNTIILDVVADEQELDHVCKALASSGLF